MRRPSPRLTPNVAVLKTFTPGTKPKAWSAGTTLACSVQDLGTDRVVRIGSLYADTTAVAYFTAPPVDTSAGARAATAGNSLGPEANVDDLLVVGGITYKVLGPARNEAGRSAWYTLQLNATK